MSTFEHIFIHTDLAPEGVAAELASRMHVEFSRDDEGKVYLSRPASDGRPGVVGGELSVNRYSYPLDEPEEESVIDGYSVVWDVGYSRRDGEVQRDEARRLFTELTAVSPWPVLLLHGLDLLVAAWEPRSGYRDFPPGTTPDFVHRALWEKHHRPSAG